MLLITVQCLMLLVLLQDVSPILPTQKTKLDVAFAKIALLLTSMDLSVFLYHRKESVFYLLTILVLTVMKISFSLSMPLNTILSIPLLIHLNTML